MVQEGEERSRELETRSYEVSIDINELVESIKREIEILDPLSDECCIYRVPQQLREINEKAYTPRVVSIGPYHHGKNELKAMEEYKRRYLVDFLERSEIMFDIFITGIQEMEKRLRNSYAETIRHSRKDFVKMMAVDGAFLIEYLLKWYLRDWSSSDRIFNKQQLGHMLCFDLIMLENQLPFFFLEHLFKLTNASKFVEGLSIVKLVNIFLINMTEQNWLSSHYLVHGNIAVQHLVDFVAICFLQPSKPNAKRKCRSLTTPTISKLHRAGAKFKSSTSRCLLDIKFDKKRGVLEIPQFKVTDYTEIFSRNIQAFEQCHNRVNYANDYFSIMDLLVDVPEDVDLLVQSGIIENWLEDNQAAATFFNNMGKHNLIYDDFYFSGLVGDLNAYCRTPWHNWKASLKQKYFNNPWTMISVAAAGFLLLLTIIQTVCSILQVVW
ncbi:conserved hypothetical protein [Ricinus communis]|uniref:Uncharacterized protein n=1 Tax=Ricinus communis TaxID=3988 RepID=B9RI92_RICCO|nr:conserved hypothetical protein [Ricinus communis]|eukprot:XP_002513461.1 UPF0481 protein At3g47200 [Ricinus communis]